MYDTPITKEGQYMNLQLQHSSLRKIATWLLAVLGSFMVANFFLSFYFYDPGWIKRDTGATYGIYKPNSKIIRADEGFTVTYVDENGYINQCADLTNAGYVLVMGNSQSNGCNVMPEKKRIALLNSKIQNDRNDSLMQVYNISVGGYQLCDQIGGVYAATEEFPHSVALIIQITTTDIPTEELDAIKQRNYTEQSDGTYLAAHLNTVQMVRNGIKEFFPLGIYLYEFKLSKADISLDRISFHGNQNTAHVIDNLAQEKEDDVINNDEKQSYRESLSKVFASLRDTYHGDIIILNIPEISLQKEDILAVYAGQHEKVFLEVCEQHDIDYLNMGEIYQKEYREKSILPYGFCNTKPGEGHLNVNGHQMVADALYTLLREKEIMQ